MWLLQTLRWWLVVEIVGLLALPLAAKLLPFLPERGLTFRRPLGLMLGSVIYWLLVTLGVLPNTPAGAAAALFLVGGLSVAAAWRERAQLRRELARLRGYLVLEGAVFLVALLAWSLFRAYSPEIMGTEKPMEFAFVNGILRSPTFPPRDPWLAGYGISYYYLGFILMAQLTLVSGLPSAVTFNLTGTLLFALTVSGSLGLLYNLVCATRRAESGAVNEPGGVSRVGVATGLLAATLVAVMGNLVGIFELIRARGWGSDALWRWLDVRNLAASSPSPTWYPQDTWWWWRASRVIHDRDLAGNPIEVISEFPFFSFLLGDNHPHVLALPFVLLMLALALNLLLGRAAEDGQGHAAPWPGLGSPGIALQRKLGRDIADLWPGGIYALLVLGSLVGALAFLNTWDYPIYLALLAGAYAMVAYRRGAVGMPWLARTVQVGVLLVLMSLLFYLPFYLGFRSQAGGIGLVPSHIKTQWQQFLLMFGVQLALLAGFLASQCAALWRGRRVCQPPWEATLWTAALAALAGGAALLGWFAATMSLLLLGLSGGLLLWGIAAREAGRPDAPQPAALLALLISVVGLGLVVSVEFFFLRDTFGTRMNTVFKFYYQGWMLLSLAAAFGVYHVLSRFRRAALAPRLGMLAWATLGALLMLAGLAYPAAATVSKAGAFRGTPTLNGVAWVAEHRPHEYEAIHWLLEHGQRDAVLVEAPGGSYTSFNWISAHTGIPTLLGWGGHQLQWRGNFEIPGRREPVLETIYLGRDADETLRLLQAHDVDYVIVGPMERQRYGVDQATLDKLDRLMTRVFTNEGVVIFGRGW